MTDYEKLRKEIATKIEAAYSRPFEEQAEAVMAVILAAMRTPTKEMGAVVRLVNRKHERPTEMKGSFIPMWNELFLLPSTEDYAFGLLYKAALNASPLVRITENKDNAP